MIEQAQIFHNISLKHKNVFSKLLLIVVFKIERYLKSPDKYWTLKLPLCYWLRKIYCYTANVLFCVISLIIILWGIDFFFKIESVSKNWSNYSIVELVTPTVSRSIPITTLLSYIDCKSGTNYWLNSIPQPAQLLWGS